MRRCAMPLQAEQLGTGHAVQQAIDACELDSTVLVLFGDVPLIPTDFLDEDVAAADTGYAMLSATARNPPVMVGCARLTGRFSGV